MNSANDEVSLDGLRVDDAKRVDRRVARTRRARASRPSPTSCATGCSAGSATGASRSRSSTTTIGPIALPESMLPVELPEITNFEPATSDDPDALPQPPLARAADWVEVELDLPGPAWAGYGDGHARRTCARRTRCRSGPVRAGTTCATSTPPTRTRSSTPRSSATWAAGDARRRLAEGRARRPLRRRRRARGAAPALRALLAQGAVRPRPRVDARAVPAAREPGHHPRRRVHRRARRVRRGVRGGRARRRSSSSRARRSRASSARWARA